MVSLVRSDERVQWRSFAKQSMTCHDKDQLQHKLNVLTSVSMQCIRQEQMFGRKHRVTQCA